MVDITQVNKLRRANEIPFRVIDWLEELSPVATHDDFGMMYKGCILAKDCHGKFAAIVGTTDQLLKMPLDNSANTTPYRILKIEKHWTVTTA